MLARCGIRSKVGHDPSFNHTYRVRVCVKVRIKKWIRARVRTTICVRVSIRVRVSVRVRRLRVRLYGWEYEFHRESEWECSTNASVRVGSNVSSNLSKNRYTNIAVWGWVSRWIRASVGKFWRIRSRISTNIGPSLSMIPTESVSVRIINSEFRCRVKPNIRVWLWAYTNASPPGCTYISMETNEFDERKCKISLIGSSNEGMTKAAKVDICSSRFGVARGRALVCR